MKNWFCMRFANKETMKANPSGTVPILLGTVFAVGQDVQNANFQNGRYRVILGVCGDFVAITIFTGIVFLGLIYDWRKGDLEWVKK